MIRPRHAVVRGLLVAVSTLLPVSAFTEPMDKVALIELARDGEFAPAVVQKLREGLEVGLQSGLSMLTLDEVSAQVEALGPELVGCSEGACLAELGKLLGARVVVRAAMRSEFESYFFSLEAVDSASGAVILDKGGDCEICTLLEASNTLTVTAEGFAADLAPLLPTLKPPEPPPPSAKRLVSVSTSPVGAQLTIDGTPVGVSDLAVELAPGTHVIDVVKVGFAPVRREVVIEPGEDALAVAISLNPLVPLPAALPAGPPVVPPASFEPERFPFGRAALASLGGGIAMLGTGGVLMGLDGDKTCAGPLSDCPTVYDTGSAGLAIVLVGSAGLVASVVLFVLEQAATGVGPETPPRLGSLTLGTPGFTF